MRVFTVPPDLGFLPALVDAILAGGFPAVGTPGPGPADLPFWTILVPTRRSARSLQQAFLDAGGARLLPRIRPIGDVDEDLIEPPDERESPDDAFLLPAISRIGRELLLVGLIEDWARANPQERLAEEIRQSPARALGLARSLAELVDSFETEEASLGALPDLFHGDFALHRLSILDFLAIIRERLPAELKLRNRMGPMERRGHLIRLEAERLKTATLKGPIIAAGSTGSIPATAELLKVIAELESGAVVLPGLDHFMDEASWNAISPQHPQFGLKRLLESWRLRRTDVQPLPGLAPRPAGFARAWLASEIMRPSETAPAWQQTVRAERERIVTAMTDVCLMEARQRREEALAIALILRECLDHPSRTAALVTPDRELARRVKAELGRWDIAIDDSAGEPLVRSAQGSLLALLIDSIISGYGADGMAALLHHPSLRAGFHENIAGLAVNALDLAVLRYGGRSFRPREFRKTVGEIRKLAGADLHAPDFLRRMSPEEWTLAVDFAGRIDDTLGPLEDLVAADAPLPIATHLQVLLDCAEAICRTPDGDSDFWKGDSGQALAELAETLSESSNLTPERSFTQSAPLILDYLNAAPVRSRSPSYARLAILGLLEARLVRPDIVIMGGLNEGKWPAQPDAGPWLNRPMRATLGLGMPERHIGLTAHDFVQGLGAQTVYLTWSRRVGDAPAVPSRWVLRLQMLLTAAGVASGNDSSRWIVWARGLDAAPAFKPVSMPKPKPPRAARPKSLSFTEIETLIRDPYAIYARKILRLEPLPGIAEPADAALRGQLIHEALNRLSRAHPEHLPADAADELICIGREVFAPHLGEPDVAGFWWPRFLRIAPWFVEQDRLLRDGVARVVSEVPASHSFAVAGEPFKLTGRADRIDIFDDGSARIVDFKTGDPPSAKQVETGLSPQLTLEAAVLELGGFIGIPATTTEALLYIKLSGGVPPGKVVDVTKPPAMATARTHLERLERLLAGYARETTGFIPRHILETEEETTAYDHLSRWGEWARTEAGT